MWDYKTSAGTFCSLLLIIFRKNIGQMERRPERGEEKKKRGKNKKGHSFKDFLKRLKQLLGFNLQNRYVVRKDLAMYDEWSKSGCLVNNIEYKGI